MKKASLFVCIGISLITLVGASVWEGAAELSRDLPETGYYVATNSLPVNTVVDVMNLENGRFTSLVVYSGLDASGYLALLSRDAANFLGIEGGSIGRIRLSQNPDPLAFSRYIADQVPRPDYDYALVPDVPRPPDDEPVMPDPSQFINPVSTAQVVPSVPSTPSVAASAFSVPMISALERGMYYVQIAAYSNAESVEYEISRRIDKNHPIAIMNVGNGDRPVYRILIGPLNYEESGLILQRYKTIFSDAFVWRGT